LNLWKKNRPGVFVSLLVIAIWVCWNLGMRIYLSQFHVLN
jgi:hypothetical protein